MPGRVTVVLVGIGGYGEMYLSALLDEPPGRDCDIVGVVDPRPGTCSRLAELQSMGVSTYPSLRDFYQTSTADLAVISSPIHLHAEHTCEAVAHHSHVLVEKPAAATVPDLDRMIRARDQAQRAVAVGYQWTFSPPILQLKHDIVDGRFGRPLTGRCLALWPRTEDYYHRNEWAGRRRDSNGRWILDSPANNAMAHYLHNLLFLFGGQVDRSANPVRVSARLTRVNQIEMFDTVAAKVRTDNDAILLFSASHAIAEHEALEPRFSLALESATIHFGGAYEPIVARCADGTVVEYPSPNATPQSAKLWSCVAAVTDGRPIACGLETARPHTLCIEAIDKCGTDIHVFPREMVRRSDTIAGRLLWVPGLAAELQKAYDSGKLPDFRGMR
jgi:predicted dehydrogenase